MPLCPIVLLPMSIGPSDIRLAPVNPIPWLVAKALIQLYISEFGRLNRLLIS